MNLYPFQEDGVAWLMLARRALLAHEMGLGKGPMTVRALRGLAEDPEQAATVLPALVICTNSMKHSWSDEFTRWWPGVSTAVVGGTASQRRKAIAQSADVTIINYESVKVHSRLAPYGSVRLTDKQKELKELNNYGYHTVVVDEAHRMKDPKSQQTRAAWFLLHEANFRIALTGTPIADNPADLWSVLHGLAPEDWPARTAFIDRYTDHSLNYWGSLEIRGLNPRTQDEFHTLVAPRFLRQTKAEVLPQLPSKVYDRRSVDMHPKQAKAYDQFAKHMLTLLDSGLLHTEDPLTRLGRLRQLACAVPVLDENDNVVALEEPSCKVDALLEVLDEAPGEPLVVFAESRKLIELCARVLDKKKVTYITVTGAVSPEERAYGVQQFQDGERQVALCTVGAGGEGITLTRSSRALFLQRPWSMVQSSQAEDRIHRIGQDASSVEIIDVVAIGTVEQAVHDVVAGKVARLEEITRDAERLRAALTGAHAA